MYIFRIIFIGACNGIDFLEKCEESGIICEAVFVTNGTSCDAHCQSLGLTCEDAWDDKRETCVKKTTGDWSFGNRCGISDPDDEDQICRCATGKGKSIIIIHIFVDNLRRTARD